jgi:hypothetical protein
MLEVGHKSFKGRKPKLATMRDLALQADNLDELFKYYKFHAVIELIRLYRTTLDEKVKFSCLSRLADLQLGKTKGEMKLLRSVRESENPAGIDSGAWKYLEARLSRVTYDGGESASSIDVKTPEKVRALKPWPDEPHPLPLSPRTREAVVTVEEAKTEIKQILKQAYPKQTLTFVEKNA